MKTENEIERLVEESCYQADPDTYNKTLRSFMQAVDDYKKQKSTFPRTHISGLIMKTAKLTAAAVFIVVLIGLHQFGSFLRG